MFTTSFVPPSPHLPFSFHFTNNVGKKTQVFASFFFHSTLTDQCSAKSGCSKHQNKIFHFNSLSAIHQYFLRLKPHPFHFNSGSTWSSTLRLFLFDNHHKLTHNLKTYQPGKAAVRTRLIESCRWQPVSSLSTRSLDELYRICGMRKNPRSALYKIGLAHLNRDACKNKMLLHLNW